MRILFTDHQAELINRIKAYHDNRIALTISPESHAFRDMMEGQELRNSQCIALRNFFGRVIDYDACDNDIAADEMTKYMYGVMCDHVRNWLFEE